MKYMSLDQKGYTMAEYIWIDGNNGVRSKTKVRGVLVAPTYSLNARLPAIFSAPEAAEALLSGKTVAPCGLASSSISPLNCFQQPQLSRTVSNFIFPNRLLTSPAKTLKSSQNGTSTVHPVVKLQATTQMSTSAP